MSSVSMGGCQAAQWMPMRPAQAGGSDRMQKLFDKLDLNSDGGIDSTELKSFVDAVAEKSGTQAADADALMTSLDSDGNGSVGRTELGNNGKALFDQLRQQLAGTIEEPPPPPRSGELFSAFDSNGDGSISSDEFSVGMRQMPQRDGAPDGSNRPAPPEAGFGRFIESLLAEYGSASASAGSETQGGSLSIAA